jgi:ADP-dependent NAD(P)H-hydrate dehydratase / NAD(P)H-hydrate epimerase
VGTSSLEGEEAAMSALYLTDQLRSIEQAQADCLAPGTLMERAGAAAARWIEGWLARPGLSFVVLCGPGNNGGDGYVCARALAARGHRGLCWAPSAPTTPDARAVRSAWVQAGGRIIERLPEDPGFDFVVDAMFGIGLARPLSGSYLDAVHWARRAGAPVFALDVPSGLNADTGVWVGAIAGLSARATVTFLGDKPGLHMADGCDAAGAVRAEPLGLAPAATPGHLNGPGHFTAMLGARPHNSHKGRFGNLAVIGGARGMLGASLLAARAALRLGCGRVIGHPELPFDPACPELMMRPVDELPALQAAVIGCGLGQSPLAAQVLQRALAMPCPLVLDADALNLVAADGALRKGLAARPAPKVLTPHPLEAARLIGGAAAPAIAADRIGVAASLAREFRAVVVLKGAGTVIADASGPALRYWVNPSGGPALASAGTGDVLSGMIGAQIAQGFDALAGTLGSVWLHGRAAQVHGADQGLLASEVAMLASLELARLKRQD